MSNMRTIRVTGKGMIKVHPDMTRITMTLEGVYPAYRPYFNDVEMSFRKDSSGLLEVEHEEPIRGLVPCAGQA